MLLVKLQPTCGSGLQLPVGLGRRICFQGHSAGCHRLKSHVGWTVGHCSWSPGVDTSIMWLAVWRLASPEWVICERERARASKRENAPGGSHSPFAAWSLKVIPLLLSYPIYYMRVPKCLLPVFMGRHIGGQGHGRWGHLGSSKSLPTTSPMVSSPPDSQRLHFKNLIFWDNYGFQIVFRVCFNFGIWSYVKVHLQISWDSCTHSVKWKLCNIT